MSPVSAAVLGLSFPSSLGNPAVWPGVFPWKPAEGSPPRSHRFLMCFNSGSRSLAVLFVLFSHNLDPDVACSELISSTSPLVGPIRIVIETRTLYPPTQQWPGSGPTLPRKPTLGRWRGRGAGKQRASESHSLPRSVSAIALARLARATKTNGEGDCS